MFLFLPKPPRSRSTSSSPEPNKQIKHLVFFVIPSTWLHLCSCSPSEKLARLAGFCWDPEYNSHSEFILCQFKSIKKKQGKSLACHSSPFLDPFSLAYEKSPDAPTPTLESSGPLPRLLISKDQYQVDLRYSTMLSSVCRPWKMFSLFCQHLLHTLS